MDFMADAPPRRLEYSNRSSPEMDVNVLLISLIRPGRSRAPRRADTRSVFAPVATLLFAILAGRASAQQTMLFTEALGGAADQPLATGQIFSGGQTTWSVQLLGGNLAVSGGRFARTAKGTSIGGSATLTQQSFAPFASDSWILRAVIRGTNSDTTTPYNDVSISAEGDAGKYGARVLIGRSDGNPDAKLGTSSTFDNLHNEDIFPSGRLLNREIRLTLVNRHDTLTLFIDDAAPGGTPTNKLIETLPGQGRLGPTIWRKVKITLGQKFTGEIDDIQFFNTIPMLETFRSPAAVDPLPASSAFNHPWSIQDANAPAQWAVVSDTVTSGTLLRWKASAATDAPKIQCSDAMTTFSADSWIFEATVVFRSPINNLGSQRASFEFLSSAGSAFGVSVPKSNLIGPLLWAYTTSESTPVASTIAGSDLAPNTPYRLSLAYNSGELVARIHDRKLAISASAFAIGSRDWLGVIIRGGKDYPFSVDNVLFFKTSPGFTAAAPIWMSYE